MQGLGRVAVILVVVLAAGTAIAAGDNDVFDPKTGQEPVAQGPDKPKKPVTPPAARKSPMIGDWARKDEGNATCGETTMSIRSNGGRLSGTTSTGGKVSQISVSGRSFSLVEDYTDVFGKAVTIRYSGELSADGNSATATISGPWQGGCTSKFTRLSGG